MFYLRKLTFLSIIVCASTVGCGNMTVSTSTGNGDLTVKDLRFAASKDSSTARSNATFKPGETAWILFDVTSFKKDPAGKAHVTEDLVVTSPGGKEILNKKNILDFNEDAKDSDLLHLNNNLDLPPTFPGGVYSITVTVHDVVANATSTTNSKMTVDAPAATGTPSASGSPATPATPKLASPSGSPLPGGTPTPNGEE